MFHFYISLCICTCCRDVALHPSWHSVGRISQTYGRDLEKIILNLAFECQKGGDRSYALSKSSACADCQGDWATPASVVPHFGPSAFLAFTFCTRISEVFRGEGKRFGGRGEEVCSIFSDIIGAVSAALRLLHLCHLTTPSATSSICALRVRSVQTLHLSSCRQPVERHSTYVFFFFL